MKLPRKLLLTAGLIGLTCLLVLSLPWDGEEDRGDFESTGDEVSGVPEESREEAAGPPRARGDTAAFVEVPLDHPLLVYSEFVDGYVTPDRAHFERSTFNTPYSEQSPGTRLSFRTDATRIEAYVDYIEACPIPGCGMFAVEVDGVVQSLAGADLVAIEGWITLLDVAESTPRTIGLVWPFATSVDLTGLRLTGGAGLLEPAPERPPLLYAAFGDSITQGFAATSSGSTYPQVVAAARGWSVINVGFGGHIVSAEDGQPLGALGADVVSVAIGTNDYTQETDHSVFRERYHGLLDGVRAMQPEVPILAITPTWVSYEDEPNALGLTIEDYRVAIREIAWERADGNLLLIEGHDLVPNDAVNFPDGLHISDAGLALYGAALAKLNRVRNASFQHGELAWELWGDAELADSTGSTALRVGPSSGGARQEAFGVEAGRWLRLGATTRLADAGAGSGAFGLTFFDTTGAVLAEHAVEVTAYEPTFLELGLVAPASFAHAKVWVEAYAGTLWIDDLQLLLDDPGIAVPYGAGVNPEESLTVLAGAPTPGDALTFGVDDPEGLATPGASLPFLAIASAPIAGLVLPGAGVGGTDVELLVDIAGAGASGGLIGGSEWAGPGQPQEFDVKVPLIPGWIGAALYAQGALVDLTAPSGGMLRLTNALELRFGS